MPDRIARRGGHYALPEDAEASLVVQVSHMTPTAANAQIEVARYTHAVPAEEAAKAVKAREVQHTIRVAIAIVAAGGGVYVAFLNTELATLIGVVVTATFGGLFAPNIIRSFKDKD